MGTVTEIQQAITPLSPAEQRQLARWSEEALEDAWDAQIEEDIKAGRLNDLIAQAESDIAAGRVAIDKMIKQDRRQILPTNLRHAIAHRKNRERCSRESRKLRSGLSR